jgi:hypothetical protein
MGEHAAQQLTEASHQNDIVNILNAASEIVNHD